LKRHGFGIIQVIFFMLILSGLLTIAMKYATITTKQTADLYVKEQAELFMSSAIELALLGISSTATRIENIKIISDDKRFTADVNITEYYIFGDNLDTEESNGMIDINIVVETNNTHPKNSRHVRLTRRSLQRL
jgi:type II secretory pathway pseudopilin PulG